MNKRYYVEQKPVEPLVLTVRDERGVPRNLSAYDSAQVFISGTNGFGFDDAGTASITDAANGRITFTFTGNSVFGTVGRYRIQVKLIDGDRWDWSDIGEIEVLRGLDE
ncbi:hypothetical protein [Nocardia amikacinitolerans]|uniref:hypothetical protein n=1 Tax=Nocardia amikacinitolerans TaxID=756689 RepID=UPI0012EE3CAE|nr:hypothetical protein [Nocardia amikacinitolerans]